LPLFPVAQALACEAFFLKLPRICGESRLLKDEGIK
jgi:hypothetical protein